MTTKTKNKKIQNKNTHNTHNPILPKLDLNITNRCNFRCIHCAFDSGKKQIKEFSTQKIKQILKDTKKLGGKKIDITGGGSNTKNRSLQNNKNSQIS